MKKEEEEESILAILVLSGLLRRDAFPRH